MNSTLLLDVADKLRALADSLESEHENRASAFITRAGAFALGYYQMIPPQLRFKIYMIKYNN